MELNRPSPALPAHERAWSRRVREHPGLLADMATAAGGPFHVLHPATFADNLASFHAVLRAAGVDGRIFFGKKANRSACYVAACRAAGAGVDVASAPELAASVAAGVPGRDLVVTGPAKTTELLGLAVAHGALVAIDALDELDRLVELTEPTGPGAPARILLRVLPPTDPHSRFGLDDAELDAALHRCVAARDAVVTEGFSFHLGGYAVAPRAEQAAALLARCRRGRALGLATSAISIGGGFAVDYVPGPAWAEFLAGHDDSWYHAGHRPARFYPYHQGPAGADMLAAILAHPVGGASLAATLTGAGVRLLLEPGRALLDRSGFSVFGVQGLKRRRDGAGAYGVVTVDGLSMSLSEQWKGSEFLPDPLLWPTDPPAGPPGEPVAACVGGASCLEYDVLTWRKIAFPRAPRRGDLLVYPNTAGYQMDKNESRFHGLPLPPRFVVDTDTDDDAAPSWSPHD